MNAAVIAEEAGVAPAGVPWIAFVLLIVTLIALPSIARIVRRTGDDMRGVGWDVRHLALVTLVFVVAMLAVPPFVPVPRAGLGLLVLMAVSTLPPIACVLAFAWALDARRLGALGFRAGNFFRAPFDGLGAYVVTAPALFALAHAWVWTLGGFGVEAAEQSVIGELRSIEGLERWIAVALGALLMPFFEEVLFRGFLQPVLVKLFRPAAGIALTSALFASLHGFTACVPIFALSCLLGYVMLRTQRLHAAWTIHAVHNGLQFLFLYLLPESLQHAAQPGGLVQSFTR